MSKINFKKMFKREYRPIILCGIVLIILVVALIFVIFYDKNSAIKVPETPQYEKLEVGFIDFSDKGTDPNDLNKNAKKELSIDYDVVTDYYKNGILLANTQVEYINDLFIVHSGEYPHGTFVSAVTKEGELKWLTKLEKKDYTDIEIRKIIYYNDLYHVFADAKHNGEPESIGFVLTSEGEVVYGVSLVTTAKDDIYDVFLEDDGNFIVLYNGVNGIQMFFFDEFLIYKDTNYWNMSSETNLFYSSNPTVLTAAYKDHKVYMTVQYSYNEGKIYNYIVDTTNLKDNITEANELNSLKGIANGSFVSSQDGRYVTLNSVLYKFGLASKLEKSYDYTKLQLENKDDHPNVVQEGDETDEETVNAFNVENITIDENNVIIKGKTSYNDIYDIYDKDLNLTKRFMISNYKYDYDNEIFLKMFYIDGKIYEIYSHGMETPSLMISTLG